MITKKADSLAKKGMLEPQDNKPVSPESLKKSTLKKRMDTRKSIQTAESTGKSSANIQGTWKMFFINPVKRQCQTSH